MIPGRSNPSVSAVVGLQWGDEGKGKFVDLLARDHDAVVRFNGGANAGHSVVVKGERFSLHLIPSGILYPGKLAVIGNGVVADPEKLIQELDGLAARGVDTSGLVLSDRAHLVMPYHQAEDAVREHLLKARRQEGAGVSEIGTTKRGIGPAYADKVQRGLAVRAGDLLRPEALREKLEMVCGLKGRMLGALSDEPHMFNPSEIGARCDVYRARLGPLIKDTTYLLHEHLAAGRSVLFEGANGTLLDVDHGTYPFVTGSSTTIGGIASGTGVPARMIGRAVGVMKAYSTRVGAGPMPTELFDDTATRIRERGREFGTTTGRPRRVGWLDLVAVRYGVMVNGVNSIALTLLDVLSGFDTLKVCTAYRLPSGVTDRFIPDALGEAQPVYETLAGFGEDLSRVTSWSGLADNARRYVEFVERFVGVKIDLIGVGPGREQTIAR